MDVSGLVDAELDLAGLDLADRLGDVEGHGAGLRIRHQPARSEHAAELPELAHDVGRGDDDVEVEPAVLELLDVLDADEVGAGGLGLPHPLALGYH